MIHMMKTQKLKLFYFQKEVQHRVKKLWKDTFLGNLSLNKGKNFVGLPVWILEFGDVTWKPRIASSSATSNILHKKDDTARLFNREMNKILG